MATDYLSVMMGEPEPPPFAPPRQRGRDYLSMVGGPSSDFSPLEDDDEGTGLMTPISEFRKGLWSSLTSGNVQMLGGAAEAFEVFGGADPQMTKGRSLQEWISEPSRQTAQPKTWEQSEGVLGVMGYLAGLTGQAVGSMAAPIAAGAAGGAVGSAVAPGVGTTIGAFGGAFSVGSLLNIGETYTQLRDEGVDPKEAAGYALSIGTGIGVIDTLGLGRLLGATALKQVKKKAISELASQAARGYLRGASEEGVTEAVQAGIRETLAGALTGNSNLQERALSALHEGFAGALGGGLIGGAGRATRAAVGRRSTLAEQSVQNDSGPSPELVEQGDGLDDLVKQGHEEISQILGDEDSNKMLGGLGLPGIGSEIAYVNEAGDRNYKVKGVIPRSEDGPEAMLVEDEQGIEDQIDLPLRENESVMMAEDFKRERDSEQFVQEVNDLTPAGRPEALQSLMQEGGYKTLAAIPEENRKDFAKALKTRIDDEQKSADEDLVFNTRMESLQEDFQQVQNFDEIDSSVREQMGIKAEEAVPADRRKPYMEALTLRLNSAAKRMKVSESESRESQVQTEEISTQSPDQTADQSLEQPESLSADLRTEPETAPLETEMEPDETASPATPARTETSAVPDLPAELSKSKPRFGYKEANYTLSFESDVDRALYITAQKKKSKRDGEFRQYLETAGYDSSQIESLGQSVRNRIKEIAVASYSNEVTKGALSVPSVAPQVTKGGTATGTYAFAAEQRPSLPRVPSLEKAERSEMPPELVRRSDILKNLSAKLGKIPIRVGRVSLRGALGTYKVGEEAIRIKEALDIPVAAHEVGHHVNKLMYGGEEGKLNFAPLKEFRSELSAIATKSGKGQSSLSEGFAEFVRLYLTRPNEALEKAPEFHASFEQQLEKFPDLRDTLTDVQDQVRRYVEQPAAAKVLSHISKEDVASPSKDFDTYYTNMVDALHPLKVAVEGMAKKAHRRLPNLERNAYEMARLFSGWAGKADHFINKGTFDANSLEVTGDSLQSILKPVEGSLDNLRIYLTARRVIEKEGQGKKTGIEVSDAEQAVKDTETPEIQQAAEKLYAYQDKVLRYLVDSRYLSEDQYDSIRKMNENYVPFYRVMDEGAKGGGGPSGKSMVDLWDPVKRMKGSTREIVDPLESIFKNTFTFINLAERNRVVQVLTDQAAKSEGSARWLEKVPAKMQGTQFSLAEVKKAMADAGVDAGALSEADLQTVATVFRPVQQGSQQENVFTVYKDGKRELWQTQEDIYRVLKDMDVESSNLIVEILAKPASLLRLGATAISPEFVIRNPIRDVWTAVIQSRSGFTPADWFRGIFHAVKRDDLYEEWRRSGGEFAAMASMDRKRLQNNLDDMMASKVKMVVTHPIQALRSLSELAEASTRLGEFEAAKRKGATTRQAAYESREVTLDFARIGTSTKAVNKIVAFWNAALQGTEKLVRVHKENPKGTVAKAFAGITIPSLALYALNHDDEDYHDLPQWQKDFFWMVPLGEKGSFLRVPKPFLWGLIYGSTVERSLDWILDKDPKAFKGLLDSYYNASIPAVLPTAILPAIEAWANKSFFTGRAVVPGQLQRLPPEHQHTPWTSEFSQGMSKMMKAFGIAVSPIVIDNTIYGYTGGTGRYATKIADLAIPDSGPKKPSGTLADAPIIKGFVTRYPQGSSESSERLYERLGDLQKKKAALSYARKFRTIEPDPMTPQEFKEFNILKGAAKQLSNLASASRRIELSESLTPAKKRKHLDNINWRRIKIARSAVDRVESLEAQ